MTPTRPRGWLRHTSLAAIALTLLSTVGLAAAAGPYERPTDRPVAETLSPDLAAGPYHKVRDPIVADGYMMHFAKVDRADGRLMFQGVQNARVWGAVIEEQSGLLGATVSEPDGAIVISGSCSAP